MQYPAFACRAVDAIGYTCSIVVLYTVPVVFLFSLFGHFLRCKKHSLNLTSVSLKQVQYGAAPDVGILGCRLDRLYVDTVLCCSFGRLRVLTLLLLPVRTLPAYSKHSYVSLPMQKIKLFIIGLLLPPQSFFFYNHLCALAWLYRAYRRYLYFLFYLLLLSLGK